MQMIIFYIALALSIIFLLLIPLGLAYPKVFSKFLGKNTSRLKLFIILLLFFLAATALALLIKPAAENSIEHANTELKPGYHLVTDVVDGDTIKVDIDGKAESVRLIGIDAPELPYNCYAQEAETKAYETLQNQQVKLKADKTQDDRDEYGRLLRYVILEDGTNFNRLMVAGGFAEEFTFITPYKLQLAFKKAQKAAKKHKLGLWSPDACGQSE